MRRVYGPFPEMPGSLATRTGPSRHRRLPVRNDRPALRGVGPRPEHYPRPEQTHPQRVLLTRTGQSGHTHWLESERPAAGGPVRVLPVGSVSIGSVRATWAPEESTASTKQK